MTEQELFEILYSVITQGSGKEIADLFNEQLNKAKRNKDDLEFLKRSIGKYRGVSMVFECEDIFNHLEILVDEELAKC